MVQFRNFDLLKAFCYIKRGVGDNIVYYIKPEASNPTFFSEITYFTSYVRDIF